MEQKNPNTNETARPVRESEPAIYEEDPRQVDISAIFSETETRTVQVRKSDEGESQQQAPTPIKVEERIPPASKELLEKYDVDADLLRRVNRDVSRIRKSEIFASVVRHIISVLIISVVSFVIASIFWIYVLNIDNNAYEKTFIVRVSIENGSAILPGERSAQESLGIYMSDEVSVSVTVKGRRADIYEMSNENLSGYLSIYIDASKAVERGMCVLDVESRVTNDKIALEVVDISPKSVTVLADLEESRELRVINAVSYMLDSPLYEVYTDSVILSEESVIVKGPKTLLDEISDARVFLDLGSVSQSRSINGVPVDFVNDNMEPIKSEYLEFLSCDTPTINVRLMILTERSLRVEVECGENAKGLVCSSDGAVLTVVGDPAVLDSLDGVIVLKTEQLFESDISAPYTHVVQTKDIVLPEGVALAQDVAKELTLVFTSADAEPAA